jgi:hypothetical protein
MQVIGAVIGRGRAAKRHCESCGSRLGVEKACSEYRGAVQRWIARGKRFEGSSRSVLKIKGGGDVNTYGRGIELLAIAAIGQIRKDSISGEVRGQPVRSRDPLDQDPPGFHA